MRPGLAHFVMTLSVSKIINHNSTKMLKITKWDYHSGLPYILMKVVSNVFQVVDV